MKTFLALFISLTSLVHGATVAVIDSGVDVSHDLLLPQVWINSSPTKNGPFPGVKYGWNFVDNSPNLFDYSLGHYFSADLKKFYKIRAKAFLFEATPEEHRWFTEKASDVAFLTKVNEFGNYIHGTHVAGITAKDSNNKVMGITFLKTDVKKLLEEFSLSQPLYKSKIAFDWQAFHYFAQELARRQVADWKEVSKFLRLYGAEVANASLGTGIEQTMNLMGLLYESFTKRRATPQEIERGGKILLDALLKEGEKFIKDAPNTLFVFAAGNDSQNNDAVGFFPSNIKAPNTISVAATYKDEFFAPFSNYGLSMVEIAAPGMMIESSIPGNDYVPVSGTSQAAPYVSKVAGKVKDANPLLRPVHIKKILMETVDKKQFLLFRVASGGIVNAQRAVLAAELSKSMSLSEAIAQARKEIGSNKISTKTDFDLNFVQPIPLNSTLTW